MTVNAPIFSPAGPLIGLAVGFVSYLGNRPPRMTAPLPETLARYQRRAIEAVVARRPIPAPSPVDTMPAQPPAPPATRPPVSGPDLAGLPVVVGPVILSTSRYVGGRTQLGAAFVAGYGIGSLFWKYAGTPLLDRVMPKYDPNAAPAAPYRPGAYDGRDQRTRYTERRMREALAELEAERKMLARLRELGFARDPPLPVAPGAPRAPDRMAGLSEVRIYAKRVAMPAPLPPAATWQKRLLDWYSKYGRFAGLAVGLFTAFKPKKGPSAPGAPAEAPAAAPGPAYEPESPWYPVEQNVRPGYGTGQATFQGTEMSGAPKRCAPCRKGSARKKPKRDACRNPVVRRTKRTTDGRTLLTTTRELKCQP